MVGLFAAIIIFTDIILYISYRGESFREDYDRLGELRGLIPPSVNVMALIATASVFTRSKIIASLGMESPQLISVSPHKKNIFYVVCEKTDMVDIVQTVSRGLHELGTAMTRLIIFCKHYKECALFNRLFKAYLGQ